MGRPRTPQEIFSDGERCSHCGRPRPNRMRKREPGLPSITSICKWCQRHHCKGSSARSPFFYNVNCRACRETGMEEHSINL